MFNTQTQKRFLVMVAMLVASNKISNIMCIMCTHKQIEQKKPMPKPTVQPFVNRLSVEVVEAEGVQRKRKAHQSLT